jgi:hypothetical protein
MFLLSIKKILLLTIASFSAIILAVFLFLIFENPQRKTMMNQTYEMTLNLNDALTYEQAISDLYYMVNIIKERHHSTRRGLPRDFQDQLDYEIKHMPTTPSVIDLLRASSRLMHTLNDAHSFVGIVFLEHKALDLNIDVDFEGNISIWIDESYKQVTKINDVSIDAIYENASTMFSYENPYYLAHRLSQRLKYAAFLYMFGTRYDEDKAVFTYIDQDDEQTIDVYYTEDSKQDTLPPYRYEIMKEENYAIFELNHMIYDQDYLNFLETFFLDVKHNEIENIIIDLRENGGGASKCANAFISYLDINGYINYGSEIRHRFINLSYQPKQVKINENHNLSFKGNLYALTSRKTFSSAAMFATLLNDNNLAYLIGEPIGNEPSMYGDMLNYQMPYSKLGFSTTYKRFIRPNQVMHEHTIYPNHVVIAQEALEVAIAFINAT